jgi:hypothetical protein
MFRTAIVAALLFAQPATAQYQPELTASQVEELDTEGVHVDPSSYTKPPIDCVDIMDRVARNQIQFLERESSRYLVLPNGDAIDAFRALELRKIEDRMRTLTSHQRERITRQYNELAPIGEIAVKFDSGYVSYSTNDIYDAQEHDTVYEFTNLPPLYELPVRPQAETLASYPLLGSHHDSPETLDFHVTLQTDHWFIGYVEQDNRTISQRIAVHRSGARMSIDRLERTCVLWPLNKTAEGGRDYWSRAPLPLYVALDVESIRATPAELACAAELNQVILRNHTPSSERNRRVTYYTEQIEGTNRERRERESGPWIQKVSWRSTPVSLKITDYDTHQRRIAERLDRGDKQLADETNHPKPTHALHLADGRILTGRLDPAESDDTIAFTIIVGGIQQQMTFKADDVESVRSIQ